MTQPEHRNRDGEPPTVYLHIGMFKSGTSFLQSVLVRNADRLLRDGVVFPIVGGKWSAQVRAARDVLGIKHHNPSDGAWSELVAMIHASPARTAVVSMEFLSLATRDAVRRIVADLSPWQVEVIVTARDLVRVLPSAWQSMVKQGHAWPFPEFSQAVTGDPPNHDGSRRFWHHHDAAAIVDRWRDVVGPDRLYLVTVPPADAPPSLLWERFASVIGVDPASYDITQDRNSNFSLSYSDSELLRQVNLALKQGISRKAQKRYSTRYLSNRVLRAASGETTATDRPTIDADTHAWAVARSAEMITRLSASGVQVVGSLDDLRPPAASTTDGPAGPAHEYPERIAEIIAALLKRLAALDPNMPDASDGTDDDPEDPPDQTNPDEASARS